MKPLSPLILMLCLAFYGIAQHPFKCRQARVQFQRDLDTGIVKIYEAGPAGWSRTYERLVMQRYHVKIVETDLFALYDWMRCYNDLSIPYAHDSLGVDFKALQLEANQLDRAGKGDRLAEMIAPWDSISNFMYERIDPDLYNPYLDGQSRSKLDLYSYLYIDEHGDIYDLYESGVRDSPLDSAMKAVAKKMPFKATPALLNAQATKGYVSVRFVFSEQTAVVYKSYQKMHE